MPTYPLSIPPELDPSAVSLAREFAISRVASPFTFEAQTQQHAGLRWIIDIEFPPLEDRIESLAAWTGSTPYTAGDKRSYAGVNYQALTTHTSGSDFPTDFAAGKWKRIGIHAAIGFYQDLNGLLGTFNLDISPYDESVSGITTVTFRLVSNTKPSWKKHEGLYYFDKLFCEEDL